MTREEAKDYIRVWCPYDRQQEIIKALEQEPCDDCISREAVLDALRKMMRPCGDGTSIYDQGNFIHNETLADVHQTVEALPPVTPQQKTGHWIFVDKAKEHARCSKCGYGNVDLVDGRVHDYCEKCGARMVESPVESEEK